MGSPRGGGAGDRVARRVLRRQGPGAHRAPPPGAVARHPLHGLGSQRRAQRHRRGAVGHRRQGGGPAGAPPARRPLPRPHQGVRERRRRQRRGARRPRPRTAGTRFHRAAHAAVLRRLGAHGILQRGDRRGRRDRRRHSRRRRRPRRPGRGDPPQPHPRRGDHPWLTNSPRSGSATTRTRCRRRAKTPWSTSPATSTCRSPPASAATTCSSSHR